MSRISPRREHSHDQVSANLVESGENALVLNAGYFGESFAEYLETYGAQVDPLRAEFGGAVDVAQVEQALRFKKYNSMTTTHVDTSTGALSDPRPVTEAVKRLSPDTFVVLDAVCVASEDIHMERWGIDVVLTASQECLGTPRSLVSSSPAKGYEGDTKNGLCGKRGGRR
ncbi:pyridoxal phosphate-dependent transferase [Russula earlei]|uniref:Pyridoxal phosphate-dependent transferase n=1 Tax=Russula earlei TaxID=71964 RepID=A0ACC0UIL3_9AGAM|nr:pyridoxal phosphate-dependent transferase [Russula earlei]